MKLGGQNIATKKYNAQGFVTLPRLDDGLRLKVRAYPIGFDEDEVFPLPEAPRLKARRTNGMVEKNPDGSVVWDHDTKNPGYLHQRDRMMKIRQAYLFASAVVQGTGDGELQFATPIDGKTEDLYLKLYEELESIGLSDGDINIVSLTARKLQNFTPELNQQALAGFFLEGCSPNAAEAAAKEAADA